VKRLVIRASAEELAWVRHAARLRHLSMAEYVKRAINAALCQQGVDAVLFRERDARPAAEEPSTWEQS
jgi:hypothetical protein